MRLTPLSQREYFNLEEIATQDLFCLLCTLFVPSFYNGSMSLEWGTTDFFHLWLSVEPQQQSVLISFT